MCGGINKEPQQYDGLNEASISSHPHSRLQSFTTRPLHDWHTHRIVNDVQLTINISTEGDEFSQCISALLRVHHSVPPYNGVSSQRP